MVHDTVVTTIHDTVREVVRVAVQLNAVGDTIRVNTVTDRLTVRERDRIHDHTAKTTKVEDAVTVERNDEKTVGRGDVMVDRDGRWSVTEPKGKTFLRIIRWIVALVCATAGLVITIRICRRKA